MISKFLEIFSINFNNALRRNSIICFLTIALTIINPLDAGVHLQGEQVPCDIKLVFGTDERGASLISYNLEMQIYNQHRRAVRGVSVHWLNTRAEIIGNSSAKCGHEDNGIKPTEFGSCTQTVQKISERLLERLGQDTWTEIINSEMHNFSEVRSCKIIGYNYGETSVRIY
ncbi:hypothetical protein N8500_07525 [Candidatus Puniceispirillum sp.]|nr:hypothetical protein [Candidatus Puniceispirillum sp.]